MTGYGGAGDLSPLYWANAGSWAIDFAAHQGFAMAQGPPSKPVSPLGHEPLTLDEAIASGEGKIQVLVDPLFGNLVHEKRRLMGWLGPGRVLRFAPSAGKFCLAWRLLAS